MKVANFALLATDDAAHRALQAELPAHSIRFPRTIFANEHGRPVRYRSAGWTRLMFAVPLMVRWVLRQGVNVLWMDTDVVALSNPFPAIYGQLAANALGAVNSSGSILASVDGRFPDEDPTECGRAYTTSPRWGHSAGGWKLCGGLFYLSHSDAALDFLREWERKLRAPGSGAKNQPHYNEALRTSDSLQVRVLPCDLFPNGYRYTSARWRGAQRRTPVLVHNNWIKGADAKLGRFKRWGMWAGDREAVNFSRLTGI